MMAQLPLFKAYPKPTLEHLPVRERPAQRISHDGADACSLVELLAAVVGGPRQIEIAHALLREFNDLRGVIRAEPADLRQIQGIGEATAARLAAVLELSRRYSADAAERAKVRSPADAAALLLPEMDSLEQEHFVVLCLDTRNHIIDRHTLYIGTVNSSHARPAEVFRRAIKRNCPAIIVAHNHPSGDASASPEDVALTEQLVRAGDTLGIEVLDHLIIGHQRFVSLRERRADAWKSGTRN
jgi:DNA repair protein RadC